jgi:hypothetical protein
MSGLVYPQLAEFPIVKRLRRRTVINRMADGRAIKFGDPAPQITEWELRYVELSDSEAGTLRQFFESAEGSLLPFTFVDPTANLLADTAAVDGVSWSRDPLLRVTGGPSLWRLENTGDGPQALRQDIGGPAGFLYCFSFFARAEPTTVLRMTAGSLSLERTVTADWRRLRLAGELDATTFCIELRGGTAVETRGLQVEAQAAPSTPRPGVRGGVYERAHFRDDALETVATGPNRHSCTVNIVHAIHI